MDGDFLSSAFSRVHKIDPTLEPRIVVCAADAVARTPRVCADVLGGAKQPVTVLADVRTRAVAGRAVAEALRSDGWAVTERIVPDPQEGGAWGGSWGGPVCDDTTKESLDAGLAGAALLVAVGSGVVSDLGKWLAGDRGIPYVCFATACSMTGYASANVAPAVRGVKTLVRARPPAAVLADPAILRTAPPEMTAAGLGDVVAKSVSTMDWRLNHLLFDDSYVEMAATLVADVEPLYLDHPELLRDGDERATEALFAALLLVGVSMTLAGTSSPASGGEHMISHTLDAMSSLDGREHDLHGRQVGVGTVLAAELYDRLLDEDAPAWRDGPQEIDAAFWGPLAEVVRDHYGEKLPRLREARRALANPAAWRRLRDALRPMHRRPSAIRECLVRGGAAVTAADIRCDRERLLAALVHAHQMRSRFTILDLAHLAGLMPGAAADLVDGWAS
ncbi:MAG: iron-containing alcohol dehydrogenase [Planctomycetes bacterium]|nr:iron-containing alcohol dehydrogenase [Planctomycetota bacterium]